MYKLTTLICLYIRKMSPHTEWQTHTSGGKRVRWVAAVQGVTPEILHEIKLHGSRKQ